MVKQNLTETHEIVLQLDPIKRPDGRPPSEGSLGTPRDRPRQAPRSASSTPTDANFDARYDFFYNEMAPMLDLYRIKAGDTLTIKAFTKTGYVQCVNIKVYGTFQFKGLGKRRWRAR